MVEISLVFIDIDEGEQTHDRLGYACEQCYRRVRPALKACSDSCLSAERQSDKKSKVWTLNERLGGET